VLIPQYVQKTNIEIKDCVWFKKKLIASASLLVKVIALTEQIIFYKPASFNYEKTMKLTSTFLLCLFNFSLFAQNMAEGIIKDS
jgi:hypothetical protein